LRAISEKNRSFFVSKSPNHQRDIDKNSEKEYIDASSKFQFHHDEKEEFPCVTFFPSACSRAFRSRPADDASVNARRVAHDSAGGSGGEDGSGGSAGSIDPDQDGDKRIGKADCDPDDGSIYRGAPEVCDDGLDNDCDGKIDEGCDCDPCGHGGAGGSDDNGGSGSRATIRTRSGESTSCPSRSPRPTTCPLQLLVRLMLYKSAARCND
jgi:hypothetical protein